MSEEELGRSSFDGGEGSTLYGSDMLSSCNCLQVMRRTEIEEPRLRDSNGRKVSCGSQSGVPLTTQ